MCANKVKADSYSSEIYFTCLKCYGINGGVRIMDDPRPWGNSLFVTQGENVIVNIGGGMYVLDSDCMKTNNVYCAVCNSKIIVRSCNYLVQIIQGRKKDKHTGLNGSYQSLKKGVK